MIAENYCPNYVASETSSDVVPIPYLGHVGDAFRRYVYSYWSPLTIRTMALPRSEVSTVIAPEPVPALPYITSYLAYPSILGTNSVMSGQ